MTGSKKAPSEDARDRATTPMSALKDPSSFGPPPRSVNYNNAVSGTSFTAESRTGPLTPAEYRAREDELARQEKEEKVREKEEKRLDREAKLRLRLEQQGQEEPAGSLLAYRNDSTGLSTTQFAPPIARRAAADGSITIRSTTPFSKTKPSLPPRLPNRPNSNPNIGSHMTSVPSQEVLTKVPIGSPGESPLYPTRRPALPARTSTQSFKNSATSDKNAQVDELQSRFARMKVMAPSASAAASQDVTSVTQWRSPDSSNQMYKHGVDITLQTSSSKRDLDHDKDTEGLINLRDNTSWPIKRTPPLIPKKRADLIGNIISNDTPPLISLSNKPK